MNATAPRLGCLFAATLLLTAGTCGSDCPEDSRELPLEVAPSTWERSKANEVTVRFGEAFFPESLDERDLRITIDTVRDDGSIESTAFWEFVDRQNANAHLFSGVEITDVRTLEFSFTPDDGFPDGEYTLRVQHSDPAPVCAQPLGLATFAIRGP